MSEANAIANVPEEAVEDGSPREAQTVHRIRANSSIMQLKKILGKRDTPQPTQHMSRLVELKLFSGQLGEY